MSQGDHVRINNRHEVETKLPFIMKRVDSWDYSIPLIIKFEKYEDPRTTGQLALFHIWCEELSQEFIAKVPDATKDGVKWMMKSMFLGKETIQVGKSTFPDQVKPLPAKKGEMCYFMDQVYQWATEKNIYLSLPQPNEYTQLKRKQDK